MLQLPVDGAFKKGILGGKGDIRIAAGRELAAALDPDAPLPAHARDLLISEGTASSPALAFGAGSPIHCSTTFSAHAAAGIEVVRSGDASAFLAAYLPEFQVPAGSLGVRLFLSAKGKAGAAGAVPAIAGLNFGVDAGGSVLFSRLITVPDATPARAAILEALSDVRLPSKRGTPADMPSAGEAVVFEYGGTLDLRASLTWGYSLTGTESLEVGQLEASVMYDLRMKAGASLGYTLAGDFVMVVQPGSRPGWVRLSVRKKRDTQFNCAAGFSLHTRAKLDSAAETVDEVLIAFFGADARRAIRLFDEFKSCTDLDALEERAGRVLFASLQSLSHTWIGRALDDTSLGDFVPMLGKAAEIYNTIDQRILDVYEDFRKRGKLTELRQALEKLAALSDREDLSAVTDADSWTLIRRLGASTLFSARDSQADFTNLVTTARKALAFLEGNALTDLLDRLHEDLKLDEIFATLKTFSSRDQILRLTDTKLQGVIEKIVGRTFEQVRQHDVDTALKEIRTVCDRIDRFRSDMIRTLERALDRSAALEINCAYAHAASDSALLDVEFDVSQDRGVELFEQAAAGRFAAVLGDAHLDVVRVRSAALTDRVSRAASLQINVIGWKLGRLVELVTDTHVALEAHDGGLVQAFTTTASVAQRREQGRSTKEVSQTVFMLTLAGILSKAPATEAEAARRTFLVQTLNRMSVGYESQQRDDDTTPEELFDYLLMARWLELIPPAAGDPPEIPLTASPGSVPSVDAFVAGLRTQFPKGLGKVSTQYVIRYDDDTLRDALTALRTDDIAPRVRASCRRVIGAHLMDPQKSLEAFALGAAYALPGHARDVFEGQGFNAIGTMRFTIAIPRSVPRLGGRTQALEPMGIGNGLSEHLRTLFVFEQELVKRVRTLVARMEEARERKAAVPLAELENVSKGLLGMAAPIDTAGGPNAFFGVMDDLIQQGRAGKGRRTSSVILEIEPPGGGSVTKYLVAGAVR